MSDTNKNRLLDARLDADLSHVADDDRADPTPARLGSASAPRGDDDPDATGAGADGPSGSVEGADNARAQRDSIEDTTSR